MSRDLLVLLGFIFVALLAFFCIKINAPAIEADLTDRTGAALHAEGLLDRVTVAADGQIMTLAGTVATEAERDRAGYIAAGVNGVATVDNRLQIAAPSPPTIVVEPVPEREPEPAPEAEPTPEPEVVKPQPKPAPLSPYVFDLNYDKMGNSIVLEGLVPDEELHAEIIAQLKRRYPQANVSDKLVVTPGAPDGFKQTVLQGIVPSLKGYDRAHVSISNSSLTIDGLAAHQAERAQLRSAIDEGKSPDFTLTYSVALAEPPPEVVAAGKCRHRFDALLAKAPIRFTTNEALIRLKSFPLLDEIAVVAQECPDAKLRIEGHTDSRGDEAYNQYLSQRRAEAVKQYLVDKGIAPERLSANGLGDRQPIADNSTLEGMAKNRRIELIVLGE